MALNSADSQGNMKNKLPVFALFLVLLVGVLAFSPIGRGSTSAGPGVVLQLGPSIFVAEMEDQICLSESQVHTTASLTSATAESEDDDVPSVFLMMLDDGVCASLSPISSTNRIQAHPGAEQELSMGKKEAALGAQPGVWYVQN